MYGYTELTITLNHNINTWEGEWFFLCCSLHCSHHVYLCDIIWLVFFDSMYILGLGSIITVLYVYNPFLSCPVWFYGSPQCIPLSNNNYYELQYGMLSMKFLITIYKHT